MRSHLITFGSSPRTAATWISFGSCEDPEELMTAPVRLAAPGEAAGGCGAARRRRVLADQLRERRVPFQRA